MKKKRGSRFLHHNKDGQMQISFGVIFSIILIIVFIAFAIYGITKILQTVNLAKITSFKGDFQNDIDLMWKSTSGSQEVEYILPKKIEQVCFVNDDMENMYFVPGDFRGALLKNVDMVNTLNRQRKFCIDASGGKISMIIKKDFGDDLVTITK